MHLQIVQIFFAKLQFAGLSQSFMQILNSLLSGSPSTMFGTKLNIAFWTKYLIVVNLWGKRFKQHIVLHTRGPWKFSLADIKKSSAGVIYGQKSIMC